MQRVLAVLLVLLGVAGLVLGRLGETVWAPDTERTATVQLSDPGPAVLIDPGVLYVGGQEGEVSITGASDITLITAPSGDIEAWLGDAHYTRVTGLSDWATLTTEEVNPGGTAELPTPAQSDLWRSVETSPSPATIDVAEFAAGEHGENEQMYRPILIVTDGTAPGAESISMTWPVEARNEWVPYAYAAGAALAVIGLVLLVVSLGGRREEPEAVVETEERSEVESGDLALAGVGAPAGTVGRSETWVEKRTPSGQGDTVDTGDVETGSIDASRPEAVEDEQDAWSADRDGGGDRAGTESHDGDGRRDGEDPDGSHPAEVRW